MDKNQLSQEFSELYSEINLGSLLNKIADKIRSYLNCEESAIFLYDSIKEELYFEIATGKKQNELKQIVLKTVLNSGLSSLYPCGQVSPVGETLHSHSITRQSLVVFRQTKYKESNLNLFS